MKKEHQIFKIKELLENGGSISSIEAFEKYRITRLSGIIHRLRHEYGMNIVTMHVSSANCADYASYTLI